MLEMQENTNYISAKYRTANTAKFLLRFAQYKSLKVSGLSNDRTLKYSHLSNKRGTKSIYFTRFWHCERPYLLVARLLIFERFLLDTSENFNFHDKTTKRMICFASI